LDFEKEDDENDEVEQFVATKNLEQYNFMLSDREIQMFNPGTASHDELLTQGSQEE
jgi:hypothetical protein